MNSMKLLKMADGGVIEKNGNCNSCTLFNKTPMVAFEGGGEKSKEADDTDWWELSKLQTLEHLYLLLVIYQSQSFNKPFTQHCSVTVKFHGILTQTMFSNTTYSPTNY